MSSASIRIDVGDILECRTRRANGTAERVRVDAVEGGELVVSVLNPRNRRTPKTRRLPLLTTFSRGHVAHYKVVERVDGTRITYAAGGPEEVVP